MNGGLQQRPCEPLVVYALAARASHGLRPAQERWISYIRDKWLRLAGLH
jgi:hypothetical protein